MLLNKYGRTHVELQISNLPYSYLRGTSTKTPASPEPQPAPSPSQPRTLPTGSQPGCREPAAAGRAGGRDDDTRSSSAQPTSHRCGTAAGDNGAVTQEAEG